jgi:hypothetical protein
MMCPRIVWKRVLLLLWFFAWSPELPPFSGPEWSFAMPCASARGVLQADRSIANGALRYTVRWGDMTKRGNLGNESALQRFSMDPRHELGISTTVVLFATELKATASPGWCLGHHDAPTTRLPARQGGTRIVDGALSSIVCLRRQQGSHSAWTKDVCLVNGVRIARNRSVLQAGKWAGGWLA